MVCFCICITDVAINIICRYGSRETVAYAASRLRAVYGSTLRTLSEVSQIKKSCKIITKGDGAHRFQSVIQRFVRRPCWILGLD